MTRWDDYQHVSINCQQGIAQSRRHGCSGCDCDCHHASIPVDFRSRVEEAKTAEEER